MKCAESTYLSNKEYLIELNRKTAKQRIPLSGTICLTNRCNLRCVHCYLGTSSGNNISKEMGTEQIISIIDQITDAGCLYLLFTGGEPLLRSDFPKIYSHAKNNGIIITVFSNGTLITEKILDLFTDLPPRNVEISLYGATEATYEKITGVKGSFRKCMDSITKLVERKIDVRLKTVLLSINNNEFFEIENVAKEFGLKFRFDPAIFPRLDGDASPVDLRVAPLTAVKKEFSDRYRVEQWEKYLEKTKGLLPSDRLYNCGAGVTGFYIDPYGILQPCLMTSDINYNLTKGSFKDGWLNVISGIRDKKAASNSACSNCDRMHLCGYCPAFFKLETGSENLLSKYLCEIGSHRFNLINENSLKGVNNAAQQE